MPKRKAKYLWKTLLIPAYCLLLSCQQSTAQIYPVQVTPQIVPPYSFKLSDYTTTTQEKLFVNLLLMDAQESGRQVRLKLFVEGPGINFRSVDFVSGALPIILNGGINERLTNLDLQPYFRLNNLVGISPQQYSRQLPEGQYRFCFEVYDQFSGQRISNRSCANIFLILNDPPLLNVPFRGDLVTAQNPQNIIFNWTPRHINAPAVQYEFILKELWDTGMDPQASFLASPPLYQSTTFANTLHYGPAKTPLLEGKTYGWQVRAFVSDGFNDTSLFRNNGMSEIYHFTYRADCPPPRFVLSEAENSQTVNINWQMGEHLRYRVQYRKKGYGENDWFGMWSQTGEATIRNLEAGTVYEFRVGGDCNPLQASQQVGDEGLAYSAIHEFTTPTEDEMAYYNCGIPPEIEIDNQEPLLNLGVNEVFTAGDFPVTVKHVDYLGQDGRYSGWGIITIPYLGDTGIRVEFENIKINTDYQLVEGMVETSYNAEWSGIVDVDEFIQDISQLLNELFSRKEELLEQLSDADGFEEQQGIISQINDLEVTIAQQIDNIPGIENLPQELQDELESLKQEGSIVSSTELTSQEITEISTADAARRNRIKEIAAIAEDLEENNANSEEIAFGENEGHPLNKESNTESIVYVSPAGVPVLLPANALPKFYTVTENPITAYGSLIGFTIEDGPNAGIYNGYRRGNEFTGYKTSKGDEPYVFGELPNTSNIQVRTIGGGDCIFLLFGGQYQPDNINPFGTGNLSKDWDKGIQWEVLFIGEQNYTTCLPPLDYDGFTEYFIGIYNPFGHGGFLRKVIATDGSVAHVYSITDLERGWVIHFQYNRGNGQWEPIEVPNYNVDTAAALDYLFGQVFSSAAGHLVLDMAGMVPAAGEFFDFANGIWYTIEGDGTSAAISFASTIPLVYATTVKNVGRVIKLADGSYQILKISSKEAEAFINQLNKLNLDDDALLLNQDLNNKAFAEAVVKNPELVNAWKKLDDIGSSDVLRMNPETLGRVKNYLDNEIEIVKQGDQIKVLTKNGDEIGDVLDNGLVKGKYSGRLFDPSKAGGPIRKSNWQDAVFDQKNIDDVKHHLGRLESDPWNDAMIKRLEDIEAGKIVPTDYDKKFITHEMGEFERYKELGYENTHYSQILEEVWNNTHSATLEDYSISDYIIKPDGMRDYQLYHPDVQQITE
ncbi:MAG: fibronectin type III domain-containing protein [Allomuricauda sp.]